MAGTSTPPVMPDASADFNFPNSSIRSARDCIFLGMTIQQKDAYLTMVLDKIIHKQATDRKGNVGICCVIIAPSQERVQWTINTLKQLKVNHGTMEELHNHNSIGEFVDYFTTRDVGRSPRKKYSMIIIGQMYGITLMLQRETIEFRTLKNIVLDLDPSIVWTDDTGTLSGNFRTLIPLFHSQSTNAKMTVTALKLDLKQLEFIYSHFNPFWQIHMAVPAAVYDTENHVREKMLIDQLNRCEPTDRIVVLVKNFVDLKNFSKIEYKIGKATSFHPNREAALKEFERGARKILFIQPHEIVFVCMTVVTRLLNYDVNDEGFNYITGLNRGFLTCHSFNFSPWPNSECVHHN